MMPDNLKQRLEWARFVISSDSEPDNIGTAAHVVLAELERLEKGEFICKKCLLARTTNIRVASSNNRLSKLDKHEPKEKP